MVPYRQFSGHMRNIPNPEAIVVFPSVWPRCSPIHPQGSVLPRAMPASPRLAMPSPKPPTSRAADILTLSIVIANAAIHSAPAKHLTIRLLGLTFAVPVNSSRAAASGLAAANLLVPATRSRDAAHEFTMQTSVAGGAISTFPIRGVLLLRACTKENCVPRHSWRCQEIGAASHLRSAVDRCHTIERGCVACDVRVGRFAGGVHVVRRIGRGPDTLLVRSFPPDDRTQPGHSEGDLIVGPAHRSAIGTLLERSTRAVKLVHLERSDSTTLHRAFVRDLGGLPVHVLRSITWDQGTEMVAHDMIAADLGLKVYFCDPVSPWQRPSNGNTNGLLRDYLPKGTDLSINSRNDLLRVEEELNRRPRAVPGHRSPAELFTARLTSPNHPPLQ